MDFRERNLIWKGQIRPRLFGRLLSLKILLICLLSAVLISLGFYWQPGGELRISEIAESGIAFSSLSFAGCLAVLALSLSLPSRDLVEEWAMSDTSTGYDVYSELVFSLFWASLMQLVFVLLCGVSIIMGGDIAIAPPTLISLHSFLLVTAMTIAAYCFRELYTVLRSAFQIANMTVFNIRQKNKC